MGSLLPSQDVFEETLSILEPAGALAIAGAKAYCAHYGLKGENSGGRGQWGKHLDF